MVDDVTVNSEAFVVTLKITKSKLCGTYVVSVVTRFLPNFLFNLMKCSFSTFSQNQRVRSLVCIGESYRFE